MDHFITTRTPKSKRTEAKGNTAAKHLHVHCGLHDSWVEEANEWHQIIILLSPESATSLTWSALDDQAGKKVASHKTGEPTGSQQRRNLTGQHVLFVEKGTSYALCFEAPSPIVVLRFTDAFLEELAPDAAWRGVLVKKWFDLLKVDARINSFFDCARELCQHKATGQSCATAAVSPHYLHALGMMLAVHLLCASRRRNHGAKNAGLSPEQLRKAQDYIDAHFKEPVRISTLYRIVGLARKRFSKLFKNSTGMLPRRYILSRRVTYAQELLREGRLRVAEIAHEAGFTDQSHMRHCFSLFCNMEPPRRCRSRLPLLPASQTPQLLLMGSTANSKKHYASQSEPKKP